MSEEEKTKKVLVNWCEMHYYEAEIEVPANLDHEGVMEYLHEGTRWIDDSIKDGPYEISMDWDSLECEEVEE
jgi:hypothetical protein